MSVIRIAVAPRKHSYIATGLDVALVAQGGTISEAIAKFQHDLYATIALGRKEGPRYHFWQATHKASPALWYSYNRAKKHQNFELTRVRALPGMPFKELPFCSDKGQKGIL